MLLILLEDGTMLLSLLFKNKKMGEEKLKLQSKFITKMEIKSIKMGGILDSLTINKSMMHFLPKLLPIAQ